MKTNAFFRGFIFGLMTLVFVTAFRPQTAEAANTRIIQLKDQKSGDVLNIEAPISSKADFDRDRPSLLFAEADRNRQEFIKNCKANKVGIFRSVKKSFVPESIGFAAAIALVGAMEAHGDPAQMKHWHEQSIMDPLAHVSFAMFMVGNRAAGEFMNMTNLTFDPCTAAQRLKPGAPLVFSETRMQKTFKPLAGGMAMSTGFIVSSVTHELLADQNLRQCARIFLGKVAQKDMAEARKACDLAHADWAPGAKMKDYLDDVLANITFVCFQGYGVAAAKTLIAKGAAGAETLAKNNQILGYSLKRGQTKIAGATAGMVMRFSVVPGVKTILFRGGAAVLTVGKFVGAPVVRAAIWIGNMVVFLKGLEIILPYFENPLKQAFTGREVTESISEILTELNKAERQGWVWTPPPKPFKCTVKPRGMATLNYEFDDYIPPECFNVPKTPAELVDLLNYKQKKWRDFVLRDAKMETSNWQDFVLQFTNTYSSAYKTYQYFISQITNQKFLVERKVPDAQPDLLYYRPTLHGFELRVEGDWDGKICHLPKSTQDVLAEGRQIIDKELNSTTSWLKNKFIPDTFLFLPNWVGLKNGGFNAPIHTKEAEAMKTHLTVIRAGLSALDCRVPLVVTPEYKSARGLSQDQLEELRKKRWTAAVARLFTLLTLEPTQGHARWVDLGKSLDHPLYPWFAKVNPYMRLNMLLGDPEPHPEGVFLVRKLNEEEQFFDQGRIEEHPMKVGKISTPLMSEYIMANMVCGPEATRRDQVSIQNWTGRSWTNTKRFFGRLVGREPKGGPTTSTDERMIDIIHGWHAKFIPPRIIKDPGYDICNTKPAQGDWKLDAGSMMTVDYGFDPHMNWYQHGNVKYRGLVNLMKANVRPDVLGQDHNDGSFVRWWAKNVEPHVKTVITDFRGKFRKIILEKYVPALVKPERAVYNGRSFALGVRNSMIDEFKLNMAILKRVHNAGRDATKKKESGHDAILPVLSILQTRFETGLKYVGTANELRQVLVDEAKSSVRLGGEYYTDQSKPVTYSSKVAMESYARNKQQLELAFQILENHMKVKGQTLSPAAKKTVDGVAKAAIVNLKNLVTELDSYNGMLLSLRMDGV